MEKKKVLFVMTSLYNGGAEKSLVNLLNEFDPNQYDIDLLLLKQKGIFLSQIPDFVNLIDVPEGIKLMYTPELVSGHYWTKFQRIAINVVAKYIVKKSKGDCYSRAFRWKHLYSKVIKPIDKKYDISVAYITGDLLYLVSEKTNADRKVLWVHNDYRAEGQPAEFDMPYMEQMDGIVSISEKCVNVLKEVFPMYVDKIYEIHNITSSAVIKKQSEAFIPEEYKGDEAKIVSIGRLANQKGFDWAITAAKILKDKGVKFQWNVLGTGALEEELTNQIKELGVGDVFHLLGARENPYPYVKNADLLVQSSRYEGKSVVLDEAKILGVPIVVTDYPTVRDQIVDGSEGMIVPMTPEGIADGIQSILTDEAKKESLKSYLTAREYGNQDEIQKYYDVLLGENS